MVRVADPEFNGNETVALMRDAADAKASIVLFPELGLTAYSCEDLFHQKALLDASLEALRQVVEASGRLNIVAAVGLPLRFNHMLFNCAAVAAEGRILGIIPKVYLPNYREFYEMRQFAPADTASFDTISIAGQNDIPFGDRLFFRSAEHPLLTFYIEICEDLWERGWLSL